MKKIFILLPVLAILVTCKKDEDILVSDVIQPLGVGYRWTYIDSAFSEDGELIGVDTTELQISGSAFSTYNEEQVEMFYWDWGFSEPEQMWLASMESGGFYIYGMRIEGVNYPVTRTLIQPYPVNVGDIWHQERFGYTHNFDTTYVFVRDTIELTCISTDALFATGVGEFECVVAVYSDYNDDNQEAYFAPNIGYIGFKQFKNGEVIYKKTLLSYALSSGFIRNSQDDELYHTGGSRFDLWGSIPAE